MGSAFNKIIDIALALCTEPWVLLHACWVEHKLPYCWSS